jgi:hypothetical protein
MKFSILKQPNLKEEEDSLSASPSKVQMLDPGPAMFLYECGECDARYLAVIYRSARGARLAIFPESGGGLATDHTPAAVAFYLDEAHKSQSAGANSAAVTMYRAAIEHVLFEQGYTKRTLGAKVKQLEDATRTHTAPAWANDLDVEDLALLKDLGNYSIHPNDGDVSKQANFDEPLLQNIRVTVVGLLELIYELPLKKEQRKAVLRAARAALENSS